MSPPPGNSRKSRVDCEDLSLPLRLLLVRSIALIFLATLALSTLLVFWRAYEKVEADMTASLAAAQRAVANAADETDGITQPGWRLQHWSPNFNGDRNVRATLQTADNSLVHSILAPPARPVPSFLYKLLAGTQLVATVDLPSALKSSGTLRLKTDAITTSSASGTTRRICYFCSRSLPRHVSSCSISCSVARSATGGTDPRVCAYRQWRLPRPRAGLCAARACKAQRRLQ